jgi:predicted O-methyltransferase YrrM
MIKILHKVFFLIGIQMINQYEQIINETKGFLSSNEGIGLNSYAKKASQLGPGLEIGSYCGKSTLYLGTGFKEKNEVLFTIDHHRGNEEQQPGEEYFDPDLFDDRIGKIDTLKFLRTTLERAKLEDTVIPIVSRSQTVSKSWRTPLSLVFIDGSHTFESADTDYRCWTPHIIDQGYLLIHDIFPDPSQGGQAPFHIYQKALNSGLFEEIEMIQTLGVLKKATLT